MIEPEQSVLEGSANLAAIVKVRLAVGLLGEQDRGNWWPSLWFTSNAAAFLAPIYGKRAYVARYHGLVEAARRVHDSRIGVGQALHLFRLPESMERRLHHAMIADPALVAAANVIDAGQAEAILSDTEMTVVGSAGPICVGSVRELDKSEWINLVAGHYLAAFKGGQQSFPYFAGD